MKPKKKPLATLLVERGDCRSRDEAERWVLAGRVHVDGQPVTKPGTLVSPAANLDVHRDQKYVSRGGFKIEHALRAFELDARGTVALDAGASVGGFTDCLLQHGAARVYAVDVGFGQIRGKLAADPRVVNLERTNISDLSVATFDPAIDLCVADLSYLSLATAVPILAALFTKPIVIVALVKPLFEGVPQDRMADITTIHDAVVALAADLAAKGLSISRITHSPILGTSGTIELLALVTTGPAPLDFDRQVRSALEQAATLTAVDR